jgi:suppressor for copper-sensitivity B
MAGKRGQAILRGYTDPIIGAALGCKPAGGKSRWWAALVAAWLLLGGGLPAHAQSAATSWFETDQGRVRLIAAAPTVGTGDKVRLGLEFRLQPHWKIYWRSPGDAGYPPRLDWSGSSNLAGATVAGPAPQRL